jgi:hypothetical protein
VCVLLLLLLLLVCTPEKTSSHAKDTRVLCSAGGVSHLVTGTQPPGSRAAALTRFVIQTKLTQAPGSSVAALASGGPDVAC